MHKIVHTDRYLIGIAGKLNALQAIESGWVPPLPTARYTGTLFKFVVTKVAPSLKAFVTGLDLFTDKEKESDDYLFQVLLVIDGTLFEIDESYSVVMRDDGFYAIGTGSDFAIGALMMGADIKRALEIAAANDNATGEPFMFYTQKKPVKGKGL